MTWAIESGSAGTRGAYGAALSLEAVVSVVRIWPVPGSFGAPPCSSMNFSVSSRACESGTCTGGDFIR